MKSGDRMTFTVMPDGTVLMRVKNKSVLDLARAAKKGEKPLPIENCPADIGIDTNVLVRFLVADDERHSRRRAA